FRTKIAEYKKTLEKVESQANLIRLKETIDKSNINKNTRESLINIIDALLSKNENRIRGANAAIGQTLMSSAPSISKSKAPISNMPTLAQYQPKQSGHAGNTIANTAPNALETPNALEINGVRYL